VGDEDFGLTTRRKIGCLLCDIEIPMKKFPLSRF
jgi:hypothetical protein